MSRLMLVNVEPGTSDEALREFLGRYGFPEAETIERLPGEGPHPTVLLHFPGLDAAALETLRLRIHEVYWRHRQLEARILIEPFS